MSKLREHYGSAALNVLTENQRTRLRQIQWQISPINRFHDLEFVSQLELKQQQTDEIRCMLRRFSGTMSSLGRSVIAREITRDELSSLSTRLEEDCAIEIEGFLDDWQREILHTLLGPAVRFRRNQISTLVRISRLSEGPVSAENPANVPLRYLTDD
jgi:hypothetical protein